MRKRWVNSLGNSLESALVENDWTIKHLETCDWEEVPMWKAMKVWANNQKHVKCIVGNAYYFYHGQMNMKGISHKQVTDGKWFVEKM